MTLLLAAMTVSAPARVVALKVEDAGGRPTVVIETSKSGDVSVRREGEDVVASIAGEADPALAAPVAAPPLQHMSLEHAPGRVRVRMKVAPGLRYEVRREQGRVALVFGAEVVAAVAPASRARTLELYKSLFPPSAASEAPLSDMLGAAGEEDAYPGIGVGPLRFRPALLVTYIDADSTIQGPEPVRDSYFQIEPTLGSQLILLGGHLHASYEPRMRMQSRLAQINKPTHDVDVGLNLPVGPRVVVRASDHYSVATLETTRADPGREYFFNLGRFTRNDLGGSIEIEVGPRLGSFVAGGVNRVSFSEPSGFFSYREERFGTGLTYALSDISKARIGYNRSHVPPPDTRPFVGSTSNGVSLALTGEILAMFEGQLSVGYEVRSAAGGGQRYKGFALSAGLAKDFGRGMRLSLDGGRGTYVSSFEQNAFYVSNNVHSTFDTVLPISFTARLGAGYGWNSYGLPASAIGVARRDRIFGWTVGLGRTLTRWAYLRSDFGREHRYSNIDSLDSSSRTFIVQLGVSPFGARKP
jgi:hypothetical protein